MSHRALLVTGLLMMGSWASAADFVAVRVNAPATLQHGGGTTALVPKQGIVMGDVVSAGARGKVALQLGGSGLMTLASLGDLQVFEAKAASAKLKLLAGALRVDSRATNGKPAQDIRLNIGSLKTRLLNADAWGANTAEGDTLCLMAGTASVQTGAATDERLDVIGSCLRREPDGQLSRFAVDADPVIVSAIAATRFEGMGEVVNTLMAEAAAEEAVVTPAAPVVAAVPTSTGSGWTIVVLSLSKPEPVAARAQALVAQGLPAITRTATVNGATMYRVAVGSFATQAEARAYAAGTLAKSGIKGWTAPL